MQGWLPQHGAGEGGQLPTSPGKAGTSQIHAEARATCTKAAWCWPHAAKGQHGQMVDGAQQEWGPTAHIAPGEEG